MGITGSLRKESYNTKLLKASMQYLPSDLEMEILVPQFPLFNQDIEKPPPKEVVEFKKRIAASDAVLFAIPEHNWTVSAVLKNAIEWGNRPWGDNSWKNKIIGMMSASSSSTGGLRAQLDLRKIAVETSMITFNWPEMRLGAAKDKFDESGKLIDEKSRERLERYMNHFVKFVKGVPKDPELFTTSK